MTPLVDFTIATQLRCTLLMSRCDEILVVIIMVSKQRRICHSQNRRCQCAFGHVQNPGLSIFRVSKSGIRHTKICQISTGQKKSSRDSFRH